MNSNSMSGTVNGNSMSGSVNGNTMNGMCRLNSKSSSVYSALNNGSSGGNSVHRLRHNVVMGSVLYWSHHVLSLD